MKIKVTLQDGTIREVLQGTTIKEAAGAISTSLKKMLWLEKLMENLLI